MGTLIFAVDMLKAPMSAVFKLALILTLLQAMTMSSATGRYSSCAIVCICEK